MKIAQALVERASLNRKIKEVQTDVISNGKIQEGDVPVYNCDELLTKLNELFEQLKTLDERILKSNYKTEVDGINLATLIKRKDLVNAKVAYLRVIVDSCSVKMDRYTKTEIKSVCMIDIKELVNKIEKLVEEKKRLDLLIQEINWNTDLASLTE